MFFVIVVLAIIGLASLLGATATSTFAAMGAVVLIPILLFKLFLAFAFFSFMGRAWHRGPGGHRWQGRRDWGHRERRREAGPSAENQFEEWHRIAHAREEVDGWVPEL